MGLTLFWLQAQACSGNTMSLLNSEEPDLTEFITEYGLEVLYHPSLSPIWGDTVMELVDALISGQRRLDLLVVEGAIPRGPDGTGRFCLFGGRPMTEVVRGLAQTAQFVVAIGDCATHGGIPAMDPNPTDATGLMWHNTEKGGFLGKGFRSRSGLPVVNLTGCPAHPDWQMQTLMAIANGMGDRITLDEFNRPTVFYGTTTHTGCTNNEYYDHMQPTAAFSQEGCLFSSAGCQGPITASDCNVRLWNRQSSKTRAGSPCLGCTEIGWPSSRYSVDRPFYAPVRHLPVQGAPVVFYGIGKRLTAMATPAALRERMANRSPRVMPRGQVPAASEGTQVPAE